jgi:hypothetical protein
LLAVERPGSDAFGPDSFADGSSDILVRAKHNFLTRGPAGLAAAVDLRLPTGEVEELLGAGATQAKVFLIGSTGR